MEFPAVQLFQPRDDQIRQLEKGFTFRRGIETTLALSNVDQLRMILPSAHVLMVEGFLRLPTRPGSTHTFRPNKRWHCA